MLDVAKSLVHWLLTANEHVTEHVRWWHKLLYNTSVADVVYNIYGAGIQVVRVMEFDHSPPSSEDSLPSEAIVETPMC